MTDSLPYFNIPGLNIVIGHLISTVMHPPDIYLWALLGLMLIMAPYRYFRDETAILTSFFLLYVIILTGVYMATVADDLNWRLSRTFSRILMYQTPAIIFLHFYAYWQKETLKNP
jgi:hypothetical protein